MGNVNNGAVLQNSVPSSLTFHGSGTTCSTLTSVDHLDEVTEGSDPASMSTIVIGTVTEEPSLDNTEMPPKENMENDARTVLLNSKPSSLTLRGSGNTCSAPSVDHFDEVMEGSKTVNGSEANLHDIAAPASDLMEEDEDASNPKKGKGRREFTLHSSHKGGRRFLLRDLPAFKEREQDVDKQGMVLFRHNRFAGTSLEAGNCAVDAVNYLLGDSTIICRRDLDVAQVQLILEAKNRAAGRRKKKRKREDVPSTDMVTDDQIKKLCLPGITTHMIRRAFQNNNIPIELHTQRHLKDSAKNLFNMTEGIFLLAGGVMPISKEEPMQKLVGHYMVFNAYLGLIFDDDADPRRQYCVLDEKDKLTEESARAVFNAMGFYQLQEVSLAKVLYSKRKQTCHI